MPQFGNGSAPAAAPTVEGSRRGMLPTDNSRSPPSRRVESSGTDLSPEVERAGAIPVLAAPGDEGGGASWAREFRMGLMGLRQDTDAAIQRQAHDLAD